MTRSHPPRLAPIPAAERTPEQQALVDAAGGEYRVFTTLIRHPGLFADFHHLGGRLLHRSALDARDRETLILRTAFACRAEYEWAQHARIAVEAGLEERVISAVGTEPGEGLTAAESLLAAAADELVHEHALSDDTWRRLSARFTEQQVIELCMLVGSYSMLAGLLNSMGVQPEPGLTTPPWLQAGD